MKGGLVVAFATHGGAPDATADDRVAAAALTDLAGVRVEAVPWDAPAVDWGRYDAVILRSTWNYHHSVGAFLRWTAGLARDGVPLWNPPGVVAWNADKSYLRDLERAGATVVPTEWIDRSAAPDVTALLAARGWSRAVVKPSVSATAFRTHLVHGGSDAAAADVLGHADALVQPLLTEVVETGEWSLVYLAGTERGRLAFSHAVLKRPADGDFRVQDEFGGSARPATPPGSLREQADALAGILEGVAPGPLLYARLDGVVSAGAHAPAGSLLLMEAELIEPALYFGLDPAAAPRFARAVERRLRSPSGRKGP